MEISEIRKDIKQNVGIKRFRYELKNLEYATKYFETIANDLLEMKGKKFDLQTMRAPVEYLIKWIYLIGNEVDFTKGILFKGHTGRGKTFLFRVMDHFLKIDNIMFRENGKHKIINLKIANVKKIAGEYQNPENGGFAVLEKYANYSCLVIDDIGKESEISSSFGNKVNIVEEIINIREELNLLTFGTTNLDKMSDAYDDRTVSRMNSLFNVSAINHKLDYRLK